RQPVLFLYSTFGYDRIAIQNVEYKKRTGCLGSSGTMRQEGISIQNEMGLRVPAESRRQARANLWDFAQGWICVWGRNDNRCPIPRQSRGHHDWDIFERLD